MLAQPGRIPVTVLKIVAIVGIGAAIGWPVHHRLSPGAGSGAKGDQHKEQHGSPKQTPKGGQGPESSGPTAIKLDAAQLRDKIQKCSVQIEADKAALHNLRAEAANSNASNSGNSLQNSAVRDAIKVEQEANQIKIGAAQSQLQQDEKTLAELQNQLKTTSKATAGGRLANTSGG